MMMAMHPIVEIMLPEIIVAAGATLILMLGLSRSLAAGSSNLAVVILAGAIAAAIRVHMSMTGGEEFAVAALRPGTFVWFVRLGVYGVGLLLVLVNRHVPEPAERGEYFSLMLFSLCGVATAALANDLILLFLALELVSVPTYILIGLSRRDPAAQEATAKYFFLGAFAAAITLYGLSFLYGAAGTLRMFGPIDTIQAWMSSAGTQGDVLRDPMVLLGLLLTLGGLAFKIAAVPLHFYVADVYQGAASPLTGFLGFVPKFAGFAAIIQVLSLTGWRESGAIFWLLWLLAATTMTVGNCLALMQHNVKRMLAYSSVAHSGYMLVALAAGPALPADAGLLPMNNGISAMLFYIVVYGVMNLGAFAALSYFRKPAAEDDDTSVEMMDELSGAARHHPWAALALAICVLGLMGFPLTGGFFGKLYIFSSALAAADAHGTAMIALVVIASLNAAIAAAYYLRILATCYLGAQAPGIFTQKCHALRFSLAACAILVLLGFFAPGALFGPSHEAARGIAPFRAPARTAAASAGQP